MTKKEVTSLRKQLVWLKHYKGPFPKTWALDQLEKLLEDNTRLERLVNELSTVGP